jgi:hypothetical protein
LVRVEEEGTGRRTRTDGDRGMRLFDVENIAEGISGVVEEGQIGERTRQGQSEYGHDDARRGGSEFGYSGTI